MLTECKVCDQAIVPPEETAQDSITPHAGYLSMMAHLFACAPLAAVVKDLKDNDAMRGVLGLAATCVACEIKVGHLFMARH